MITHGRKAAPADIALPGVGGCFCFGDAMDYRAFIESRSQDRNYEGFDPVDLPDWLKDFQRHLCEWSIRKGRAAVFADCGMGKTPMQLVWARNVHLYTGKPVLIGTPLAVAHQTVREAQKFGIDAAVCRDGKHDSPIVVTNYERLHYFSADDFGGAAFDESSAIKSFDAQRTASVTEFMRRMKYRSLWTATAAPNDFFELGTSSEALGYLGFRDMITHFFKQETSKDYLGWGRTKYRFRGHAEQPFWKWVSSWARALRKPSDLGFDDSGFDLPQLTEDNHIVSTAKPRDGMLFTVAARDMNEERAERRHSIRERCEKAAELVHSHDRCTVSWCELNEESDILVKSIGSDCKQVSGSMSDDEKEETFAAFQTGQLKHLVTKPKIGAWGLNWQHCSDITVFPSHSFEQYYQLVRRCWRYGQTREVAVDRIMCEGQVHVLDNLARKQSQASEMFSALVRHMGDALHLFKSESFDLPVSVPSWM